MKRAALGGLAIGYQPTTAAFKQAMGVEAMNDQQVREAFAAGTLHHQASIEALRRSQRHDLADELEAQYLAPAVEEVEEASGSGGSDSLEAEDSAQSPDGVEDSASEPSPEDEDEDDDLVSIEDLLSEDSEEQQEAVVALKVGGGWYELEDGTKVRKADLPDNAQIVED